MNESAGKAPIHLALPDTGEEEAEAVRQVLLTLDGIFGGSAANAFDIGGRHLMPLSKRHAFADLRQMAPPAAIDLVRQRATLPELHEYERESLVHRGTIVQRPMRMARR